jgi:hypothetical protein
MSVFHSPAIVTDGIIFHYDMNNAPESYRGAPVTNLIPSPGINGYPTVGNGWGSYNTNQYNNNTYFSIGTISSVASNIVTTSGNHPLRSYDVVTPQTTGGGLTAGTNYLVKKLSNTTFSLHPYNSSQDGTQGYINPTTGTHKVYDDFANNVRISINSSSFPTMWWGPPHLPNSGLVKELRTNGFTHPLTGQVTDCMRLHYIRDDDVKDGMSYGVDASLTPGAPHITSFYARAVDANAVGKVIQYQVYNYTGGNAAGYSTNFTLGAQGQWNLVTLPYTPAYATSISYWFAVSGGKYVWEWSNMQTETGSVANLFTPGPTRSNTQSLFDTITNRPITVNSLTYGNNNTFSFDSSNNYITPSNATITDAILNAGSWTISAWVNMTTVNRGTDNVVCGHGAAAGNNGLHLGERSARAYFGLYGNDISGNIPLSAGTWYNLVYTYNFSTKLKQIYVNGVFDTSGGTVGYGGTGSNFEIGRYPWATNYKQYGSMPYFAMYNKVLTADEIVQNFNAIRRRYNI